MTLAALVCGAGWALASPVGSSPDDNYHLTSIWCAGPASPEECTELPDAPTGEAQVEVPGLVGAGACYAFVSGQPGSCQDDLPSRVSTNMVDQGDYPGPYYRVMHLLVGADVERAVVLMRLANVLLAVAVGLGTLLAAPPAARRVQTYVLTAAMVPLGLFTVASVNPSSWAVVGITAMGFALHSFFLAPTRRLRLANAALVVVGWLMGATSRGDASVYAVVVALSLCVFHAARLRRRPRLVLLPAALCAISLVWVLGSPQVSSIAASAPQTERGRLEVALSLALEFPALITGMFGYGFGLGWLDTPVPALTAFGVLCVVGFMALAGLGISGRAKTWALLVLGGATLAMPLFTLYRQRAIVGEGVQPRYLLPLVPVLLMIVMSGVRPRESLRLTRLQGVLVFVVLAVGQSAALYVTLRRFTTGIGAPGDMLFRPPAWWWPVGPGPLVVWVIASLAFAVLAYSVVIVSLGAARVQEGAGGRRTRSTGTRAVQGRRLAAVRLPLGRRKGRDDTMGRARHGS